MAGRREGGNRGGRAEQDTAVQEHSTAQHSRPVARRSWPGTLGYETGLPQVPLSMIVGGYPCNIRQT
jgi:hypothetical protein